MKLILHRQSQSFPHSLLMFIVIAKKLLNTLNRRISLSFPPTERLVLGYHSLYDRLFSLKIEKLTSSFPFRYFPSRFHKRYFSLKCFDIVFHPNFSSSCPSLSKRIATCISSPWEQLQLLLLSWITSQLVL